MNNLSLNKPNQDLKKTLLVLLLLSILSGCVSSPDTLPDVTIGGLGSRQALICDHAKRWQGQVVGNGHCVALIKHCSEAPPTKEWRPGPTVKNNTLLPGTIIATFVGHKYPSTSGYHAAIFIEQTPEGIWVWDQWRGKAVHRRLIRWHNPRGTPANRANSYSVVTVAK